MDGCSGWVFSARMRPSGSAEFILSASPQVWKKVLRKEDKFLTDFMLGKITLQQGSKVGVLAIAPHSNTFVDALTQIPLQFPDEMTPAELLIYRDDLKSLYESIGCLNLWFRTGRRNENSDQRLSFLQQVG